jgi:histone arginine demethylase JMJD6
MNLMLDEARLPKRRQADRRRNLTRDDFMREYALPAIPVVLEGAASEWPAIRKWNDDFFLRNYGALDVTVSRVRDKRDRKRMRLDEYLGYMRGDAGNDPYYLASWVFDKDCPELLEDYENPPSFDRWEQHLPAQVRPQWRWLFMGPVGSGSPLHVDTFHSSAWNAVITGKKRWLFYHPNETAFLYQGKVDVFHPDPQQFPRFARAEGVECTQYPGDVVFTPSGWWHQVYNEEPGISITENFIDAANCENVMLAATMTDHTELLQGLERVRAKLAGEAFGVASPARSGL